MIARLAAYRNVWWSLANEYDFMKTKDLAEWDRVFAVNVSGLFQVTRACAPLTTNSTASSAEVVERRNSAVASIDRNPSPGFRPMAIRQDAAPVWAMPTIRGLVRLEVDPELGRLVEDVRAPGEIGDQHALRVPDP